MTTLPENVWSLTIRKVHRPNRANSASCVFGQPRRAVACAKDGAMSQSHGLRIVRPHDPKTSCCPNFKTFVSGLRKVETPGGERVAVINTDEHSRVVNHCPFCGKQVRGVTNVD